MRIGIIQETLGEGVDAGVISSIRAAASHLEQLGSVVEEVCCFPFAGKRININKDGYFFLFCEGFLKDNNQ